MRSLRSRLFIVLVLAFVGFWALWVAAWTIAMLHEGTGLWDNATRTNATQILRTMPRDTALAAVAPVTGLPAQIWMRDDMIYQVWAGDRLLVRSVDAPATPIKPDFVDGFEERERDGETWRVYAVTDPERGIQVQAGKPYSHYYRIAGMLATVTIVTMGLLLALLGAALWFGIRWSLRPVDALRAAAARRAPFDLAPLPAAGLPEELRQIAGIFNDKLAQVDRAVQNERRFVADAAHELRTPLAVLSAHAQVALRATDVAEKDEALRLLADGVERGARLSEQLLDLARLDASAGTQRHRPVDLAEAVELVLRDYAASPRRGRRQITLRTAPCRVTGDVDEIGILLRNLVDNALRFGGEDGRLLVECGIPPGSAGRVVLCVADDGPGVPPAERERIFDRFYRVAGNGQRGSGIGLSLVAHIARSHGAQVDVGDGLDGRGLRIAIVFPP